MEIHVATPYGTNSSVSNTLTVAAADPCSGVTCTAPPACYASPGTCSGGTCSYSSYAPAGTSCNTTAHCTGDTYYSGKTCNAAGSCSVESGDSGCCLNSYCDHGQSCNTTTHSCYTPGGPTITVNCPTATATSGSAYSSSVSAANGTSPYTYSISAGSLPAGLTLSGSTISGNPTSSSTFTLKATDAGGNTGTASCTITLGYPVVTPVCPYSSAEVYYAYSKSASASGGSGSGYTYSISAGSLPANLTITASSGLVSGTPTTVQTSSFTLKATDGVGNNGTVSCSITVGCRASGYNCAATNNCCSGLTCDGTCYAPLGCVNTGGTCSIDSDCCYSYCSISPTCPHGYHYGFCVSHACADCANKGHDCNNPWDCCNGVCTSGKCSTLGYGATCTSDSQCTSPEMCDTDANGNRYCGDPCVVSGSATLCYENSECCSGKCNNYACVDSWNWTNGHSCTPATASDCASGLCQNSVCVACLANDQSCSMLGDSVCCSGICNGAASPVCDTCYADGAQCPAGGASKCCAKACMPKPGKPALSICGSCVGFGSGCDMDSECCSGYKCSTQDGSGSCIANITVKCPATTTATAGTAYSGHIPTTGGSGTYPTYSASGLPTGMSASGGYVSGTPPAVGNSSYSITVTDSEGSTKTVSGCSLNVSCGGTGASCSSNPQCCSSLCSSSKCVAALAVSCPYSTATAEVAYDNSSVASGGVPPYQPITFSSLPAGLSASNGRITGTPTTVGGTNFQVSVTDYSGKVATSSCSIYVDCAANANYCTSSPQCCSGNCTNNLCTKAACDDTGWSCAKAIGCCPGDACIGGSCGVPE